MKPLNETVHRITFSVSVIFKGTMLMCRSEWKKKVRDVFREFVSCLKVRVILKIGFFNVG